MSSEPVILIVDDEQQIRRLLQITLEGGGFRVAEATTGEEGLLRTRMDRPEAVILDLGLPDMDGLEVLRAIRLESSVPVVILSARNAEQDIVTSLNAGADDYLVKPFRTGELIARIRAALRHRPDEPTERIFRAGAIEVDLDKRIVKKDGEQVKLTATEYSLLSLFVKNPGRVLTHRFILEKVWGPTYVDETHYSRIYVAQLRKKLEENPAEPSLLVTESGIGYRLVVETE
jgi:two-component system, OmpR family, KDP operon response regulator KdpE